MTKLTLASAIILRHKHNFITRRILFAGDIQDDLPTQFIALDVLAHTNQYHQWQLLNTKIGPNAKFGLTLDVKFASKCDTLIYYWPKNKQEALFQLSNILSLLPLGSDVFVVGENRSGVRSVNQLIHNQIKLIKIYNAQRCCLYYGQLNIRSAFDLAQWWQSYLVQNVIVKTLPGVFSRDGLDAGSALLISTLENSIRGKVLNVGCGAGVISAMLAKLAPKIMLTMSDVNASAIESSRATLTTNSMKGTVLVSNVYSNITGRFDMILSNPPFHDGRKKNLIAAETLLRGAIKHLRIGGRLRIVANAFLPYRSILDSTFGTHEVLAHNGRFSVYQATLKRSV